jgi:hypothetical protein
MGRRGGAKPRAARAAALTGLPDAISKKLLLLFFKKAVHPSFYGTPVWRPEVGSHIVIPDYQ